ncbi:MAG: hypothetical protein SGI77_15910 [Pirellulaceae bacterium]|nr:hypothetical protein [Pirellulaceae bacterium]
MFSIGHFSQVHNGDKLTINARYRLAGRELVLKGGKVQRSPDAERNLDFEFLAAIRHYFPSSCKLFRMLNSISRICSVPAFPAFFRRVWRWLFEKSSSI